MSDKLSRVIGIISGIENVKITEAFSEDEKKIITGNIAITVNERTTPFKVIIFSQYPQQFHEEESIKFVNIDLIETNHVNWDGSICLHTHHSPYLNQKLLLDFNALKAWIIKYLVNKEIDAHYEHIVVPRVAIKEVKSIMLFTDIDHSFQNGSFGKMEFSLLSQGKTGDYETNTYVLQSLNSANRKVHCKWSATYRSMETYDGIYLFMDRPPVKNRRFALESWHDLTGYLSYPFLDYLEKMEKLLSSSLNEQLTLILGYPISTGTKIHWEMIGIEKDKYPNYRQRLKGTRFYQWILKDQQILWGETINCSYEYFFGRGRLTNKLTASKILILGIGAVGSIVATTLCRGGCTDFTIFDYDTKEPGNVCRSEYKFISGVNNKVDELKHHMLAISPFVTVIGKSTFADEIKYLLRSSVGWKMKLEKYFDGFDLIIDCTTDDDLAYSLSQLEVKAQIINLSITNHARELVCVTNPNLYQSMMHIFSTLKKEDEDLFNPTGCWNPTFKAGYNDIAVLVQFAIKHISMTYQQDLPLRNFYLSAKEHDSFNISITQF